MITNDSLRLTETFWNADTNGQFVDMFYYEKTRNYGVEGEGYALAYKIASDNLKLGLSVVADSCNPILHTRKQWEKVAISNNSIFINIKVICSYIDYFSSQ